MSFPSDSVGLVTPQKFQFEQPLELECGRILPRFDLMVETYGTLNADKSNAILICHALSGHHHAAGYHHADDKKAGWWDSCIGPGKAIDTNHFFIVSLNNIGGCNGSTGPTSPNPENENRPYGPGKSAFGAGIHDNIVTSSIEASIACTNRLIEQGVLTTEQVAAAAV